MRRAVILAAGLVACSRAPPPPAPPSTASASLSALPPAPPIASLPPIEVSPLIRSVSTSSARDYPDHPASIPGVLTIHAPDLDAQSHGVGREPWRGTFLVTNETAAPISVKVSDLTLRTDEAGLSPADRAQAVIVKTARAEGVTLAVEGGAVTFTVAPRRKIEIDLDGEMRQDLRISYHVSYRHEAVFTVGGARVIGRGYTMYFRYPHLTHP